MRIFFKFKLFSQKKKHLVILKETILYFFTTELYIEIFEVLLILSQCINFVATYWIDVWLAIETGAGRVVMKTIASFAASATTFV